MYGSSWEFYYPPCTRVAFGAHVDGELHSVKCGFPSYAHVFLKSCNLWQHQAQVQIKKNAVIFPFSGLGRRCSRVYLTTAVQWRFMSACYSFMNTWLPELSVGAACVYSICVWVSSIFQAGTRKMKRASEFFLLLTGHLERKQMD